MDEYLQGLFADNIAPKDLVHQQRMKLILDSLLEAGEKEKAGLLFNVHRIFTGFRGYGANEEASSDVVDPKGVIRGAFEEEFKIPDSGAIVVDQFVMRNLPAIVTICKERGVDLGRIVVRVPKMIFAAQLTQMEATKKQEFEDACGELREDQFLMPDLMHTGDINIEGKIALWFGPRVEPVHTRLHGESEAETMANFIGAIRAMVEKVVVGGRVYINLAYPEGEPWKPLRTETAENGQTKLTGISESIALAVAALLKDLGFELIDEKVIDPKDVDPKIDHKKSATYLHAIRRNMPLAA